MKCLFTVLGLPFICKRPLSHDSHGRYIYLLCSHKLLGNSSAQDSFLVLCNSKSKAQNFINQVIGNSILEIREALGRLKIYEEVAVDASVFFLMMYCRKIFDHILIITYVIRQIYIKIFLVKGFNS